MTTHDQLENTLLFQNRILKLLAIFCTEAPVNICFEKLSKIKHQWLSLSEIAWLQAISEMNIKSFNTIQWGNQNLLRRIEQLQQHLYQVSQENSINIDALHDNDKENQRFKKTLTQNYVSPPRAIQYFNSIRLINRLAKGKEEANEIERAKRRLFRAQLAEINLTTELMRNLRDCCKNNPVALIPTLLPSTIWLKTLAHYLAISSKRYQDYGEIDYDDPKLINNAISIHKLLREKLNEILGIKLNECALMLPAHREIAGNEGILDIAVVATNPKREIPDDWSIEVTQELGLRILKAISEFNYLFDIYELNNKSPSNENSYASSENVIIKTNLAQIGEKLTPATLENPGSKAKNLIRAALEAWVKYL